MSDPVHPSNCPYCWNMSCVLRVPSAAREELQRKACPSNPTDSAGVVSAAVVEVKASDHNHCPQRSTAARRRAAAARPSWLSQCLHSSCYGPYCNTRTCWHLHCHGIPSHAMPVSHPSSTLNVLCYFHRHRHLAGYCCCC